MAKVFVLLISLLISVIDLRIQKIPNILTILLALTLLFNTNNSSVGLRFISIALALFLSITLRFGMGDLKLITVLLLTQSSIILSMQYLSLFLATASLAVIAALVSSRGVKGSLAFGPVILLPFTAIYLAI